MYKKHEKTNLVISCFNKIFIFSLYPFKDIFMCFFRPFLQKKLEFRFKA